MNYQMIIDIFYKFLQKLLTTNPKGEKNMNTSEMKNTRKEILKSINSVICNEILYNVDSFIGGSFRFGWMNVNSDIDYFILIGNDICSRLVKNGFCINHMRENYVNHSINYIGVNRMVHITVLQDKNVFEKMKEEHNKLDLFLRLNPHYGEMAKVARKYMRTNGNGKVGSTLYKFMVELMKEYNKE